VVARASAAARVMVAMRRNMVVSSHRNAAEDPAR
jgi:hypothetical protein